MAFIRNSSSWRWLRGSVLLVALVILSVPAEGGQLRQSHLDNGLELLLKEAHGGPMVASIVTVGAGARYEDANSYGASHFLEHMCFNGTEMRSREEINEGIKAFGGYINAFTRREYTCYILLIPTEYLREGLEIQADMLFGSVLPEAEFEKEKRVVLEEMNKDYDSGSYRGDLHRNAHLLTGTPYAHPVLGTVETIQGLDRDEVVAYYKERYQPSNCRLFLVGDFARREAEGMLEEIFGGFGGDTAPPPAEVRPDWSATPSLHVYAAEEGQPRLDLAWLAPPVTDGDYPAQLALADMLSDEHRSPLRQGDAPLDLSAHVELFEDFSLFNVTVSADDRPLPEFAASVSSALAGLADWAPDADWTAEVAHGLRVEEVFLQDTYHYYAMMKSAELHMGGYPLLSRLGRSLAGLDPARVRAALESSLLDGSPKMIWSAVGAEESTANGVDVAAFEPRHGSATVAAAAKSSGGRKLRITGGRPAVSGEQRLELDNGLTVLLRSDPSSGVCAAHVLVRGRSAMEPEGREGMVTLAHRLLESGTERLDGEAVSSALSRMGAKLKLVDNPWIPFDNYYTREDFSFIRLEVLDESAVEAISLLGELLDDASYPEGAVEREKGRMMGSLARGGQRPSGAARAALYGHLFGDGPRGRAIGGSGESLAGITAQELREFHDVYFAPERMILSVVSSKPLGELRRIVRNGFGDLGGDIRAAGPAPTAVGGGPAELSRPMDKAQVSLLAARKVGPSNSASPELRVLVDVLSARMALELREKQGLAYSLGAGLRYVPGLAEGEEGFGLLSMSISTGAENREQARRGMIAELERLVSEPPSEEEIFRAVNGRWGRELMRDLSRIHQAYRMGLSEHLGKDPFDGPSRNVVRQREADPAHLAELARQILLQDDWIWVQAGGGLE